MLNQSWVCQESGSTDRPWSLLIRLECGSESVLLLFGQQKWNAPELDGDPCLALKIDFLWYPIIIVIDMPQTHRKCIWAIPHLPFQPRSAPSDMWLGRARCDERQGWPIFGRHQGNATIVGQGQFMLLGGIFQPETVWGACHEYSSIVGGLLCAVKQMHRTIWIESRQNRAPRDSQRFEW